MARLAECRSRSTSVGGAVVRVAAVGFPVVGVVGGGQLARMMAPPAIGLGITLRVLARDAAGQRRAGRARHRRSATRTTSTPCAPSPPAATSLTFDHEHVPTEHLRTLEAEGVVVRPGPDALEHAQDKLVMRRRLTALGVPCPRWAVVSTRRRARGVRRRGRLAGRAQDPARRLRRQGRPAASTTRPRPTTGWPPAAPLLAEERVAFTRELAVLVARSPHGQAAVWPVVETVQVDGVCREVLAPAPIHEDHALAAQQAALRIAEGLGVTGVMAVEMFDTDGGRARQRARDAAAQQRALDDRGRAHQPVRAAPARRARPAAGRHPDDRAAGGDGQRPRRRLRRTCTPATCTAWRTTPACGSTCTASRYAQGERWVTSRRWAAMLTTCASVPGTPRPSCEETSMS